MVLDMIKEVDDTSYRKLLNSLDAEIITFNDFVKLSSIDNRYVLLRHDLDRHMAGVLCMAQIEYDIGVKSTYFPLPTSNYFDYSDKFLNIWKGVCDLGHEVGIHNDFLWEYFNDENKTLEEIISKPIEFFRKNGIEINGTSMHGNSKLMKGYGVRNSEVWKKISMKDFGLNYETYDVNYDLYLTDIRKTWLGFIVDETTPKGAVNVNSIIHSSKNKGIDIIKYFNLLDKGVLQILTHVPRWKRI